MIRNPTHLFIYDLISHYSVALTRSMDGIDASSFDSLSALYFDCNLSGSNSCSSCNIYSDSSLDLDSFDGSSYTSAVDTECSLTSSEHSSTLTATLLQSQLSDVSSLPPHFMRISPLPTDSSCSTQDSFSEASLHSPLRDCTNNCSDSVLSSDSTLDLSLAGLESPKLYSWSYFCTLSEMESIKCSTPETVRLSSLNSETVEDFLTSNPSLEDLSIESSKIVKNQEMQSQINEISSKENQNTTSEMTTEPARHSSPLSTTLNSLSSLPTDTITINVPFDSSTSEDKTLDNQNNCLIHLEEKRSHPNPVESNSVAGTNVANSSTVPDTAYATEESLINSRGSSPAFTESCTITPLPTQHITPCSTNPTATPIPSPIPAELLSVCSDTVHSNCSMLTLSNVSCITEKLQELTPNSDQCFNKDNLTLSHSEPKNSCVGCSEHSDKVDFSSKCRDEHDSISLLSEGSSSGEPDMTAKDEKSGRGKQDDFKQRRSNSFPERDIASPKEEKHPFWKPFPNKSEAPIYCQKFERKDISQSESHSVTDSKTTSFSSFFGRDISTQTAHEVTDTKTCNSKEFSKLSQSHCEIQNQQESREIYSSSSKRRQVDEYSEVKSIQSISSTTHNYQNKESTESLEKELNSQEVGRNPVLDQNQEKSIEDVYQHSLGGTEDISVPLPSHILKNKVVHPPPIPPPPSEEEFIPAPPVPSLPVNLDLHPSDSMRPRPPPRRYLLIPLTPSYGTPSSSPPPTPVRSSSFFKSPSSQIHSRSHTPVLIHPPEPPTQERDEIEVQNICSLRNSREIGSNVNGSRSRINSLTPVPEEQPTSASSSPLPSANDKISENTQNTSIMREKTNTSQELTNGLSKVDECSQLDPSPLSPSPQPNTKDLHPSPLLTLPTKPPAPCSSVYENRAPYSPTSSSLLKMSSLEQGQGQGSTDDSLRLKNQDKTQSSFVNSRHPSLKSPSQLEPKQRSSFPSIQIPPPPPLSPPLPPPPRLPPLPPPPLISSPTPPPPTPPPPPTSCTPPSSPPVPPVLDISANPPPIPPHPRNLGSSPTVPGAAAPPPPPRICSLPNSPLFKARLLSSPKSFPSYPKPLVEMSSTAEEGSPQQMPRPTEPAPMSSSQEQSASQGPPPPPPPAPTGIGAKALQPSCLLQEKNSLMSLSPYGKLVIDRSDLPLDPPDEEVRKAYSRAVSWSWLSPQEETVSLYTQLKPVIQKGPQCGLVALSMASQICGSQVSSDALLKRAKSLGMSNHGEMFSAEDFATLAREFLEGVEVTVHEGLLSDPQNVTQMLSEGNLLLVPYDSEHNHMPCQRQGNKAHWALLCGCLIQSASISSQPESTKALPDIKVDHLWHLRPRERASPKLDPPSPTRDPSQGGKAESLKAPPAATAWMKPLERIVVLWRQGKSRGLISSPLGDLQRSNRQLTEYNNAPTDEYVIKSVKEGLSNQVVVIRKMKLSRLTELIGILKEKDQ